jgi:Rrf2 family nitric oxide-sensitive transcriptional repressor
MFSQTVEYALRAVVWLAAHPGDPQTNQQIAAGTLVPAGYLAKVMQSLARAGLVSAQRGKGGGFELARGADRISVLEAVNAVEPIRRIEKCPLGIEAHGSVLCPLHSRLDAALASVEKAFRTTTIAQVLAEPSPSRPLCQVLEAQSVA